jgi:NCS1 family nucleobase:cation symporter-1
MTEPGKHDSDLWNEDLAPTPPEKRTWNVWHVTALWVAMSVCIPTYMLASDMIRAHMSVGQAVFTVLLGNLIVLVPMVLNAHAGTAYGIPFPVFARASFGIRGANIPALARALVACGWFGIQAWIGGGSLVAIFHHFGVQGGEPLPVLGIDALSFACFFAFWLLNVYFIHRGVESIKFLESLAAPLLLVGGTALLAWSWMTHGLGDTMSAEGLEGGAFWASFGPFLTGMVGFWATLALNIPDFSRFVKSQRAQILGQTLGLPTTMAYVSFIGAAVASGTGIWNPNDVVASLPSDIAVVVGLTVVALATLSMNIAANVVSPANDFSNLAPKRISYRMGGFITAAIGLLIMPWRLTNNYVFGWLNGYGALLGPIGGIMVADYWLVRGRHLVVDDLYRRGGIYDYQGGVNRWAVIALVLGVAPNVAGFFEAIGVVTSIPSFLHASYSYAWFIGFGLAAAVYTIGMRMSGVPTTAKAEG